MQSYTDALNVKGSRSFGFDVDMEMDFSDDIKSKTRKSKLN